MSDSTTRYKIEELQDSKGNVIHPQTDARGVWVNDEKLYDLLDAEITDEQISSIFNNQGGKTV